MTQCTDIKFLAAIWVIMFFFEIGLTPVISISPDDRMLSKSRLGPPYPVTASWFKDRWTIREWNDTLDKFTAQGGDTVFLRAPPVIRRTREDLDRDVNFRWCGSYKSSTGNTGPRCYDEAVQELKEMGLNVTTFLTYQYEEGFSDAIMRCPKLDRKINSSRIYYRVVLPAADSRYSKSDPCAFANGSNVAVLFTSFAGVDAHQLLLEAASPRNISVYFGLPAVPKHPEDDVMTSYYAWVEHVLFEHRSRYSKMSITSENTSNGKEKDKRDSGFLDDPNFQTSKKSLTERDRHNVKTKTLYDTLVGYNAQTDHSLGEWIFVLYTVNIYKLLGEKIRMVQKRYAVSATINLNRGQVNSTFVNHVEGFSLLVNTGVMDVVIIQEGRGFGKGAYFWPHEKNQSVAQVDPVLSNILHYQNRTLSKHVTFDEVFLASNQEIFTAFQNALDQTSPGKWSGSVEFWLGLEAFEFLRDDPCLPIDPHASGMGQLLNRASKQRLDWGIATAGAKVQRVISFAWDSDFTCTTNEYNTSLHSEIMTDLNRPTIANCSFHSPHNLSIVVIGFNLEGETQGFAVEWKDTRGHKRTTNINGYYFELDYGIAHHLVPSLQYVMLWDIPDMFPGLAPDGTISVAANGGNTCFFEYSLPYDCHNKRTFVY